MVEQQQGGATQEGEIDQHSGVAGPGAILAQTGIASPVVTVLHARPVAAHQLQPLCRGAFVWLQTRKVIARFHTGAGAFGLGALRLNDENAAGEGQLPRHRFDRREAYAALLEPTVSTVGLGKRGELTAPAASACLSSAG